MKTKSRILSIVGLLLLLTACKGEPKFINHASPNLVVSFDAFSDPSTLTALGCNEIQPPSNLLGGLTPSYPLAICAVNPSEASEELMTEIDNGQFFYYTGGLFGSYVRYVIQKDGEFVMLKTEENFRKIFAPVESPDEALSYALAVRNLSAYYGLAYYSAFEYEVDTIEDTYVTPEADGYLVHLFYDQVFGCGPHWTSTVDVLVSEEGNVEEVGREAIYRDPNLDELCVD